MITKINPTNINTAFFRQYSNVSFGANVHFPNIDNNYTNEKSKNNTITIWGSSRSKDFIAKEINLAYKTARALTSKGYNVLHGCGDDGIMGAVYRGANDGINSHSSGENLAILKEPLWGDEDTENCKVIGKASSEMERANKFMSVSNTFIIFPGSAATIQEVSNLIQHNLYTKKPEDKKQVILVGKDYYQGLLQQYKTIEKAGLLKNYTAQGLFKVVETADEILDYIPALEK